MATVTGKGGGRWLFHFVASITERRRRIAESLRPPLHLLKIRHHQVIICWWVGHNGGEKCGRWYWNWWFSTCINQRRRRKIMRGIISITIIIIWCYWDERFEVWYNFTKFNCITEYASPTYYAIDFDALMMGYMTIKNSTIKGISSLSPFYSFYYFLFSPLLLLLLSSHSSLFFIVFSCLCLSFSPPFLFHN